MYAFDFKNIQLESLRKVRGQLHQALQFIGAAGETYIEPQSDHSHSSTIWLNEHTALASYNLAKNDLLQIALDVKNLEIVFLNDGNQYGESILLDGKKRIEIETQIKAALQQFKLDPGIYSAESDAESPYSPKNNEKFKIDVREHFDKAAAMLKIADDLLKEIKNSNSQALEVRCWPHHFDIATLISVEADDDPEKAKSIGVGFLLGDESYDQPYFYVALWPHAQIKKSALRKLQAGHWHTENWIGSILTSIDISRFDSTEKQLEIIRKFLSESIEQSIILLQGV